MTLTALALVLAAQLAQQGARAEGQRTTVLEGIAVQAGDELVFLSEVERFAKRARELRPPNSREEEQRQNIDVLRELWVARLTEQEGADLGLDPAQIGRISRASLQAARDKEGLDAYLDELKKQGKDALAEEQDSQKEILRYMWRQAALGNAFAANRATRDQSIRPGELYALYEENKRDLAPETVQLRRLIVSSQALGGPEAARASCEDARARVLAGEDLALLVEERGAALRETRGLAPFIPLKALDPLLIPFAEKAEVSDLSEVLPLTNPKTLQPDPGLGYQLAEFRERRAPPVPDYSSPDVQRVLREVFTQRRANLVLGRASERLRRESYSWVNPLLSGAGEPARP